MRGGGGAGGGGGGPEEIRTELRLENSSAEINTAFLTLFPGSQHLCLAWWVFVEWN